MNLRAVAVAFAVSLAACFGYLAADRTTTVQIIVEQTTTSSVAP